MAARRRAEPANHETRSQSGLDPSESASRSFSSFAKQQLGHPNRTIGRLSPSCFGELFTATWAQAAVGG